MHNLSFITRKDPATGGMVLPEGKRKLFISYRHADEALLPLCEKLSEYILEALDVAIWYDHKLTAGREYDEEIRNAITRSDAFVLLLTPNIISSKYVLEQEVPFAIKQQVAIIPIIAGISEKDLPTIEKLVGRVHMPVWFWGSHDQTPEFSKDAKDQLLYGLKLAIASKDLIEEAKLFYEKGYQNVSMRNLTPEQIFVKAYGNLFGVDATADKSLGIKLLESILGMYGDDQEFTDFQEQVACELLSHFYRTNQPDLLYPYMRSAVEKQNDRVFPLLFNLYRTQWHSEFLCREADLSFALLEKLYKKNFETDLDVAKLICSTKERALQSFSDSTSDLPHIGELEFDGHTAYFQKSLTEDRTVNLFIDGRCVSKYSVYSSCGDVYLLYMAYDRKHRSLITLHADFDHYGPETYTRCEIYLFDGHHIRFYSFGSEWLRGLRQLPYSPYTFKLN